MAHAQFIVAAGHRGAIRELFAWHVELDHTLAHDTDRHLATGGHGEAPAIPAARRQDHPARGADVLHRALVRQRQSYHAPLIDDQALDVA
jgi:hypothetical protein